MAQIKCEECGQMFSENEASCPNCACPNDKKICTTNTGYEYETTVKDYADIGFLIANIAGILVYFFNSCIGCYSNARNNGILSCIYRADTFRCLYLLWIYSKGLS